MTLKLWKMVEKQFISQKYNFWVRICENFIVVFVKYSYVFKQKLLLNVTNSYCYLDIRNFFELQLLSQRRHRHNLIVTIR